MKVLVTGASGRLGQPLVAALQAAGHEVRPMSSRPGHDMVRGDLATGAGLEAALAGVEGVIHAASAPRGDLWQVDVAGSRRLANAVDRDALRHLVYVSIVGVDRNPYSYYRAKFAAEQVLLAAGLPVTVLRATQFHELVDELLQRARRGPLLPVPRGWRLQPVSVREVADHLAEVLREPPVRGVREFAGPEQLDSLALAREWAHAQHPAPRPVPVPLPGKLSRAVRDGGALSDTGARGLTTYAEHLADRQR